MKEKLKTCFEIKDLGEAVFCLGIRFTRDREKGTISLDQSNYINSVLKRFEMDQCKPVCTPVDLNAKVKIITSDEEKNVTSVPYQSAVGCLLYISRGTRPDISFAVGMASQFNQNHTEEHWTAVKRIMRYLRGTTDTKLTYSATPDAEIRGYSDSDWGNWPRSITGYGFILCGGAITWKSKRQATTALSSTEAEYMALTMAAQEAIWLNSVVKELNVTESSGSIGIVTDNRGAIELTKNNVFHARTKHISVKHHFIRQAVSDGEVHVGYLCTEEMPADFLTKGVPRAKHELCSGLFGLDL